LGKARKVILHNLSELLECSVLIFLRIGYFCFVLFFSALCLLPKNNLRLFAQICTDYQLIYLCTRQSTTNGVGKGKYADKDFEGSGAGAGGSGAE